MIRRLLSACVGAVFVGVLAVPNGAAAKPPDLPEDGKFTLAPASSEENVLKDVPREIGRKPSSYLGSYFAEVVIYDHDWFDWIVSHWRKRNELPRAKVDVLSDVPRDRAREAMIKALGGSADFCGGWAPPSFEGWWTWLISHWIARQQPSAMEQNEGFVQRFEPQNVVSGLTPAGGPPVSDLNIPIAQKPRPMPQAEPEVTCPYLRQQRIDRHACQHDDPEIGHDVMDNLKRLEEADKLLELAQDLANDDYFDEAIECCEQAAALCPGSPCAARANDAIIEYEWVRIWRPENPSFVPPEWARYDVVPDDEDPGNRLMVSGLMKACHLLMGQGMQHQAAELARQAYALDPQRVAADPLVYKMHLLAETLPAGASEASEPPTCPYCPNTGKPIDAIVPKKKKRKVKHTSHMKPLSESVPLEIAINTTSGLRVNAECPLGGNVYHLRYKDGSLEIWKTTDASKSVDPRQIEYEWEHIWFTDMPSRLTPERIHGGIRP